MRPHLLEPREGVFELGEFDREPGFVGTGPGREDVEDHFRTVDDLDLQLTLEIPGLGRR